MFSGKKLLLLGFIIVLLVAIPITVYLVQQQQQIRSKAAPSTILSIVTEDTESSTKVMNVGETARFKVKVEPGTNEVNSVKFTLTYDPTKIEVNSGDFTVNTDALNSLQGPNYASGTITVVLSTSGQLTKIIRETKVLGTLTAKAIASTNGNTTKINFGTPQVLSVGATDTFNENVFSSANPAIITINDGGGPTPTSTGGPTPTSTGGPTPTPTTGYTPTITPTNPPTSSITPTISEEITPTLPDEDEPTNTPTNTPTPTTPGTTNQIPSCTSLALDSAASGNAPYTLMFTASGSDSDGTISKVTFNFGDGQVRDVTEGTGSNSISAQLAHTYTSGGSFTATAVITDNNGAVSSIGPCSQSISINGPTTTATATPTTGVSQPAIAPTGPGNILVTIGSIGAILAIIGVLLLFTL